MKNLIRLICKRINPSLVVYLNKNFFIVNNLKNFSHSLFTIPTFLEN